MQETTLSKTGKHVILLEPKDLRIGNILDYDGKFVHVTNLSLDIDDEYQETIGFCEWGKTKNEKSDWNRSLCDKLSPIPLTPEILEKCGFKKNGTFDKQFNNGNQIEIDLSDEYKGEVWLGGSDSCTNGMGFVANCQYLHQLQNLYFALTGEELTVNL